MTDASVSPKDFARLETKLDRMTEAIENLVIIEERQTVDRAKIQENAIDLRTLETEVRALERKVEKWLNLVFGGGFVVMIAFEVLKTFWSK